MAIIRKLFGLNKPDHMNGPPENPGAKDQLSVDVAIASQKNEAATLRVRETLAQLLKENDGLRRQ